jgi:hypothetical protein
MAGAGRCRVGGADGAGGAGGAQAGRRAPASKGAQLAAHKNVRLVQAVRS